MNQVLLEYSPFAYLFTIYDAFLIKYRINNLWQRLMAPMDKTDTTRSIMG